MVVFESDILILPVLITFVKAVEHKWKEASLFPQFPFLANASGLPDGVKTQESPSLNAFVKMAVDATDCIVSSSNWKPIQQLIRTNRASGKLVLARGYDSGHFRGMSDCDCDKRLFSGDEKAFSNRPLIELNGHVMIEEAEETITSPTLRAARSSRQNVEVRGVRRSCLMSQGSHSNTKVTEHWCSSAKRENLFHTSLHTSLLSYLSFIPLSYLSKSLFHTLSPLFHSHSFVNQSHSNTKVTRTPKSLEHQSHPNTKVTRTPNTTNTNARTQVQLSRLPFDIRDHPACQSQAAKRVLARLEKDLEYAANNKKTRRTQVRCQKTRQKRPTSISQSCSRCKIALETGGKVECSSEISGLLQKP